MITENGPWHVKDYRESGIVLQSDDFTHDVHLSIHGDFESSEQKREYAEEIERRLNGSDLVAAKNEIVELKKLCTRAADVIQFPLAKFTVNVDGLIQQLRSGSNLPTALYDNIKEKL